MKVQFTKQVEYKQKIALTFDQKIKLIEVLRPFLDSGVALDSQDTANEKIKDLIAGIDSVEVVANVTKWTAPKVTVKRTKKRK